MGGTSTDPKVLDDAVPKASLTPFPNPRVEFYDKFQRAADSQDRNFLKVYNEHFDSTLVFSGLLSAVTTALIVDVQRKLEPDFQKMNYDLLKIIASTAPGDVPTGTFPEWNGPDPTIVRVGCALYSSLALSLLATFVAALGRQWVFRYAWTGHESTIERGRHLKLRMSGMVTWRFDEVMQCLPLMLQAALLLLGYALSDYLSYLNQQVAGIVIGFSAFGLLFYLLTGFAATLSYNCPYQTPLSITLRFLFHSSSKYFVQSGKWFGRTFSNMKERWPRHTLCGLGGPGIPDGNTSGDHIELPVDTSPNQPLRLFNVGLDWNGYALDSSCITWMFEMPIDVDSSMAIARFIPEIVWHAGIQFVPLEWLYNTFLGCFDYSSGRPIVKPASRDMAYLSAKALLHIVIQRKCIGDGSENAVIESISMRHKIVGWKHYEGDSDLESTLGIIDHVFGYFEQMCWQNFSFTLPHHAWMSHILLYRTWDVLGKGEPLPDDVREFILHSFRLAPPPPTRIVADCLLMVGMVLGIRLHIDDLLVVDKSHEVSPQISRIYEKLTETFRNPTPTTDEIDRALEAMQLITPLSENDIAQSSYHLFHVVMQAPVSPAYSQEKKWEVSRLTMHGAYKWDEFLPWVEDPQDILTFLDHHFDLATSGGQDQHEPIQDALRALAYASGPVTREALERFEPTEPSFVRGICYIFQDDKPFQLRKAALFFLPLIGDRWFNTPDPIMEPDQMRSLCVDWASTVDSIEHTSDVQKAVLAVLFGMINSSHWRPHIVTEKWTLLEYFTSVPDDSAPLRRCIDNPELMDEIKKVDNPTAMILWLAILWLKYKELIPKVQEQLETATKVVALGRRRTDLDMYMSVMDSELRKAEDALAQYNTQSTDPTAIALRAKVDNIQQARVALVGLKGG